MNEKIILIGMPGSGKSSIGKVLAEKMNIKFIDLDNELELAMNKKVTELFSTLGEPGFRKMEHEVLKRILPDNKFVLACGGGTPCFHSNMDLIKASGLSFYLFTDVNELEMRLKNNISERPLLNQSKNLLSTLEKLSSKRELFFGRADFLMNCTKKNPAQIVDEILWVLKAST